MKKNPKPSAQMRADSERQRYRAEMTAKREEMIYSVADTVAADWYKRCVRCQQKMNLYWRRPREQENVACPIIDFTAPNWDFALHCEILPSMSRDRVRAIVADAMRSLPMLSSAWYAA